MHKNLSTANLSRRPNRAIPDRGGEISTQGYVDTLGGKIQDNDVAATDIATARSRRATGLNLLIVHHNVTGGKHDTPQPDTRKSHDAPPFPPAELPCGFTIIYGGEAARKFGWRKGRRVVRFPGIGLGGIMLPASNVVVNDQEVEPGGTAGTSGRDVCRGHVVVLDFPAKRIYVALRADLPAAVWDRTVWTPAEIRGGKVFVHLKLNGADYKDLFLDTGSSAFPLIVDTGQWKTLTQTVDDNHPPKEITASSWGKKVKFVGAPALGAIEIASLSLDHPMIFHTPADPNGFHSQPHGAYGLLGNALFWNDILVLDFSITPQLGILR